MKMHLKFHFYFTHMKYMSNSKNIETFSQDNDKTKSDGGDIKMKQIETTCRSMLKTLLKYSDPSCNHFEKQLFCINYGFNYNGLSICDLVDKKNIKTLSPFDIQMILSLYDINMNYKNNISDKSFYSSHARNVTNGIKYIESMNAEWERLRSIKIQNVNNKEKMEKEDKVKGTKIVFNNNGMKTKTGFNIFESSDISKIFDSDNEYGIKLNQDDLTKDQPCPTAQKYSEYAFIESDSESDDEKTIIDNLNETGNVIDDLNYQLCI